MFRNHVRKHTRPAIYFKALFGKRWLGIVSMHYDANFLLVTRKLKYRLSAAKPNKLFFILYNIVGVQFLLQF